MTTDDADGLDGIAGLLAGLDEDECVGWGRVAALQWFDEALFAFVVPPAELSFGQAAASPFVEQAYGSSNDGLPRFRIREAARPAFLDAQSIDVGWLLAQTAGLTAGYFRQAIDPDSGDSEAAIEEIRYLAVAEPGAALIRLMEFARERFRAGATGSVIAAAAAAMHWRQLHPGLARRNAPGRDRLARVADLVHAMASAYNAPRGDADPLARIRLLQVALSRIPAVWTAGERWLADEGHALVAARLAEAAGAGQDASLRPADDWAFALTAVTDRSVLTKQTHDISFSSTSMITLRSAGTLHVTDVAGRAVRPVVIGVLPRPAHQMLDSLTARDRRDAAVPILTGSQTYRLLAVTAAVGCAFPEPGHLAAEPTAAGDVYQRLNDLRADIEWWLAADHSDRRVPSPGAFLDSRRDRLPESGRDRLVALLAEFAEHIPVIGVFEAGGAGVQVVGFEVQIPLAGRPHWSPVTGRITVQAAVGYAGNAEQLLRIGVPRRLLPLRFASSHFHHQSITPARGEIIQTFRRARDIEGTPARVADLTLQYGIGPAARLQVVAFAILAAVVGAALLERPAIDLSLGGFAALGAITAVGGLIELATRFGHRSGAQQAGRGTLLRPGRVSVVTTTAAFALITAALFGSLVGTEATLLFAGLSVGLGAGSALLEAGLLLRDSVDAQRWRRTEFAPGPASGNLPAAVPAPSGVIRALADSAGTYWAAAAAEVRSPVLLPVTWSQVRSPAVPGDAENGGDFTYVGLAQRLTRPGGRRVTILGAPGSGKTSLATLAANHLLSASATVGSPAPVPVPVPLLGWRPAREPLDAYAARRVLDKFPALATPRTRSRVARDLSAAVRSGEVALLLDGVDELPEATRSEIIAGIDAAGPDTAVIMMCRTEEYWTATSPVATSLSSAAVLEVEPLPPHRAAGALATTRSLESAGPLVGELAGAGGDLAGVLTSPEMLRLAQVGSAATAGLPPAGTSPERWLTETAIAVAYRWGGWRSRSGVPPADTAAAGRWLSLVADTAARLPDAGGFHWWELYRARPLPVRLLTAALAGIAALAAGGLPLLGEEPGVRFNGGWLLLLLALAIIVALGVAPRPDGATDAGALALIAPDLTTLGRAAVTAAGVGGILMVHGLDRMTCLTVTGAAVLGCLLAGLALRGVLGALARRHDRDPRTPRQLLRDTLRYTFLGVLLQLVFALCGPAVAALAFGTPVPLAAITMVAALGLLPLVLGTWGWYHLSRVAFATRGRLPWRLLTFLDDAVQRRLLRRAGHAYAFRHRIYQQALTPHRKADRGSVPMNYAAAEVGRFFRARPNADFDDYEVWKGTGVPPGSLYPALQELVAAGWLEERWAEPAAAREPRNMIYRLTEAGGTWLGPAVAEFDLRHPRLRGARVGQPVSAGRPW